MELLTIKKAVKEVLEECHKARNSDMLLWILVNRKFGNKVYIEDLSKVISSESVRRSRQWFNQRKMYLADEDIDEMRLKHQKEFRQVFR